VAEGVGFEPTRREDPPTRFPVARTRPDYATLPTGAIDDHQFAAERVGFEPTVGDYPTLLFESSTLNHSDTSPPEIIPEAIGSSKDKTHRKFIRWATIVRPGGFEPPTS
jgi:hypothetical protein